MKGVIANCLGELVTEKFGKEKWEKSLETAGLGKNTTFLAIDDINDADVLKVVDSVCKVLGVTLGQAADAFGEYWVCTYAPKIYKLYYQRSTTAKDFLLRMDDVHRSSTENIPNARPPRFEYTWIDDKTLIMKYKSHRGLIDFMIGLVKGVGKYYKENLQVSKLDNSNVKIVFS